MKVKVFAIVVPLWHSMYWCQGGERLLMSLEIPFMPAIGIPVTRCHWKWYRTPCFSAIILKLTASQGNYNLWRFKEYLRSADKFRMAARTSVDPCQTLPFLCCNGKVTFVSCLICLWQLQAFSEEFCWLEAPSLPSRLSSSLLKMIIWPQILKMIIW